MAAEREKNSLTSAFDMINSHLHALDIDDI